MNKYNPNWKPFLCVRDHRKEIVQLPGEVFHCKKCGWFRDAHDMSVAILENPYRSRRVA